MSVCQYECRVCAALVNDKARHQLWHAQQERLINGLRDTVSQLKRQGAGRTR